MAQLSQMTFTLSWLEEQECSGVNRIILNKEK